MLTDVKREIDALTVKRDALAAEADELKDDPDLGQQEHRHRLIAGSANIQSQIKALTAEWGRGMLADLESNPFRAETIGLGEPSGEHRADRADDAVNPRIRTARDRGLRTVERHKDLLTAEAADNLDGLLRNRDPQALGARYLQAVSSPHYNSAFGKLVADPTTGHLRMSAAEVEAIRTVSQVEAERAMSVGTTTAGGFAIPFTLDPSILLSSAGVISPIRKVARVESIVTDQWKGVSSAGVTAAFAAEATEASDNAPTLAQPVIDTAKAFAFVPFSIEIGQDWDSLQAEMANLFADAKDTLEATAFLTGTGTNAPGGLLNIAGTGGLTTTERVQSATTNVYALADVYSLKAALPARFVGAASWVQHPTNLDRAFRFVGGNSTEPVFYPTRDGKVLGIPTYEWSTMTSTMATTNKIAIYGDFRQYLIADRIGGTVELIPHLFGATNRFPTGQRGLYYYWRVGGGTLVNNAFRYLEVL